MLTAIEQPFAKYLPEFTNKLHNSIFEGISLPPEFENCLYISFKHCYIGQLREKIGLPDDYYLDYMENFCVICVVAAGKMPEIQRYKIKSEYLKTLQILYEHLQKDHHISL